MAQIIGDAEGAICEGPFFAGRVASLRPNADLPVDESVNLAVGKVVKANGVQVVSAQGAAVADAAGGATIDAEARAALNALLARLRAHGLIAT